MFKAEKILWGEGLFLRPQHFQVQDSYHEQRLNHTIRSTIPFAYGIKQLRFDENQLGMHVLALENVDMIWQDGEIYQAPAQDLLPEPILLDDLNLRGEMLIYLALPLLQANKQNITFDQNTQSGRYHSHLMQTHDLFTNASPAEISLLRRRAEFKLFDSTLDPQHDLDGFLYLPIGQIKRHSSGSFELDRKFIPPLLHIEGSESLTSNLKRTLNVIRAKIKTIQTNNRENEQKLIEFRSGDIVSFWLVNALNTAHATLNHVLQNPQIHPERLFFELLRLTGSLLTFSTAYEVDQLPQYRHHQLQESFQQLDMILRDLLDTIISSRYISIALKEIRPSYWLGSLESDKITRESRLYIAVSSSMMQTHELVQIVPLRFKVGSTLDVEQRVVAALPAIPLHHLMQVPTAIPVRSGVSYFEVEPHHELYQRMLESESICIYVPAGFQDISIELIAVINA
ncbi:MAG: type VI secretion system baseplate subunit TssK [Acinetobacter ursingii]|uniref:Type VI secretion system baseplate subunit TssK n=2 Tax=Acinetobacter ursingii TaxID=108980 RepID=A0AA46S6V4_9GAMM|nr:type VI secretion system baseplate subunit TssK [Acinetobacter ursingii]ENV76600.1 type VI secretion protein [Acinetobacter ursingii DSM 16037 = CIP 107286]MCU4497974.1 type VI secretion system baseplate subunit TssK [Acinetobacter ursingii]MDA3579132.1 type VI secretion system baseplate subunit TssK [Acinetobacter ursingii]MDH0193830.1 type VI secretion system baseplate subunit TssK [Acinetobacter ursingii]MDH0809457.1 type VI secretion system baseplate subunit TssK [Acinetobacter ursingii